MPPEHPSSASEWAFGVPILAKDIEEPLSVPQAAELIGISRIAAYKAVQEGRLPHAKIGNVLLVSKADAEAYKRSRTRRGDTGKPPRTARVRPLKGVARH
jgi:excisionase family DNA binding protein